MLKWLLLLIALLLALLMACIVFEIPLPLGFFRPMIENMAKKSLGRDVKLDGPISLVIGSNPELTASGLSIANPEGYSQENLLYVSELQVKFDLVALLDRRIQVDTLGLHGIRVNLEQQAGRANWEFGPQPGRQDNPPVEFAAAPDAGATAMRIQGIDEALVTGAVFNYSELVAGNAYELVLDSMVARAPVGQPTKVEAEGSYEQEDWTLVLTSAAIGQLLAGIDVIPLVVDATFVGSTMHADLDLDPAAVPPQLDGSIGIDLIDTGRLMALQGAPPEEPVDLAAVMEPIGLLNANLNLTLGELLDMPVSIRDAEADIKLVDGRLDAPLSVTLDDIPVTGQLSLGTEASEFSLAATLAAEAIDVGDLAGRYVPDEDIEGQLIAVSTTVSANGRYMTDFVRSIDLELGLESAALSFGNAGVEERVELMLEQFSAGIAPDDPLKASLSGQLLGEPVILTMSGPNLIQFLDDDAWPVQLEGKAAAINLSADGVVTTPTNTTGPSFTISTGGDRFGELSSWIGVDPDSQLTYQIRAGVEVTANTWEVTVRNASLGQTSLRGELSGEFGDSTGPINAELHFNTIHVEELGAVFSADDEESVTTDTRAAETAAEETRTRTVELLEAPEEAMENLVAAVGDVNLQTPLYPRGLTSRK